MQTTVVSASDDLAAIVADINRAQWDEANALPEFDEDSLRAYLQRQDTIFLTCYGSDGVLMGIASSRVEMKAYNQELWLYVDEVDVCADQRQKGAGKAIMESLIDIAEENDCEELWLGTEVDNHPANALYRALDPDDVSEVVGYTWETDDDE